MIPFGPFHPDAAGINTKVVREARNVVPAAVGFAPLPSAVAATNALDAACYGATVILRYGGGTAQFSGSATKLYSLTAATWSDVSRAVGGAYATAQGERWRFAQWGELCLSVNYNDVPQKFDMSGGIGTKFTALGGSPPKARFIDVVRDQVVLAGLNGNENRIQWSGTNNAEFWTPGSQNCDYQDFQYGGPVRGFIGGATGYVFLSDRVVRMTQTPGASTIYQFDDVQGAKGLYAPSSLVRVGDVAYYVASDGPWEISLVDGSQKPIGVNKWRLWFVNDVRAGTQLSMYGAADPSNPIVVWAYVSKDNPTSLVPDRLLIYNRFLEEAAFADVNIEALSQWITSGVTLDTMNSYGTLDTLPYSLDSPFWKAGAYVLGLFGLDHKLAYLQGANLQATLITADGEIDQRVLIKGTRPAVDASTVQVAVSCRERDADNLSGNTVTFDELNSMEDTGICPAWNSGNVIRAKIVVPAASTWSYAKGIDAVVAKRGRR
jgi:hypothetical protein